MPRSRRSFIWNHFTKAENGDSQCDYCMKTITTSGGSTSNLIKHLKCKHGDIWQPNSVDRPVNEEYIVLQGENYEEFIQSEEEVIDENEKSHYQIISSKPKKPKLSSVEGELIDEKSLLQNARIGQTTIKKITREEKDDDSESLEIFARYMVSLMKGMSKKKCEDAQLKIVSVILEAKKEDAEENGHR